MSGAPGPRRRPRLFIGSSGEGRAVADCLKQGLHPEVETTVWSEGTLECLVEEVGGFDFAALVLGPDDPAETGRGAASGAAGERVSFALGLFVGRLGRERVFLVHPEGREDVQLPSSLAGVTVATYREPDNGNLRAAVGPACVRIGQRISTIVPGAQLPIELDEDADTPGGGRQFVKRSPRRATCETARVRSRSGDFELANISVSGALLAAEGPVDVGRRVDLELDLDGHDSVKVVAEVVRVQRPDWGRVGGIGVRFIDYTADALRRIDAYVCADSAATWGFWGG